MTTFFNRVSQFTATTGQGTVTLGTVTANDLLTFADAGAADADETTYLIEDGDNFELGRGTIGDTVTTLSRDTVLVSKDGGLVGTDKLELTGSARVRAVESAEDLNDFVAKAGQFTSLPEVVKTAGWTLTASDSGGMFVYNSASGGTVALPAVASAGDDVYWFSVINTGALTIDPNSTELIDGASTLVLQSGETAMIWSNEGKTAWRALVFPGAIVAADVVASGTVALSAGAIGTYAFLRHNQTAGNLDFGDTRAGSNLRPANSAGANTPSAVSGTWRCMGQIGNTNVADGPTRVTLFMRIS